MPLEHLPRWTTGAVFAFAAATSGCAPSPKPVTMSDDQLSTTKHLVRPYGEMTCTANQDAMAAAFDGPGGYWGDELVLFLRDRCQSDGWSPAARDCVYDDDYVACLTRTLAGWQRDRLLGVLVADQEFDVAATPHADALACTSGCAPPADASPCEQAARRIGADVAAEFGPPAAPPIVWTGLTAIMLDQCRMLKWSPAAGTCIGARGLVRECIQLLTDQQTSMPEQLIGGWVQAVERRYGTR